ncbi:rhodanese-like domain-containing protein [Halostella litorea]|uniref:rhodanese-like domain-containing protein n=1 Tax=Halostella litorea TaxID=2528831 RepID=UPI0010925E72|nr:rhodanese-like domain-containing protein [Halostella litorea]
MDAEIPPERVRELLAGDERVAVVDIRSPTAFRRGHVPGSVNVPFPQLATRAAEFGDADHVVTVCPHGKSSVRAARLVAAHEAVDAAVYSMAGGLEAWDAELDRENGGEAPDAPF